MNFEGIANLIILVIMFTIILMPIYCEILQISTNFKHYTNDYYLKNILENLRKNQEILFQINVCLEEMSRGSRKVEFLADNSIKKYYSQYYK